MADFFSRLRARTLGDGPIASPRMLTQYETGAHFSESGIDPQAREKAPDAESPQPAAHTLGTVPPQHQAIVPSEPAAVPVGSDAATPKRVSARNAALPAVAQRRPAAVHEAQPAAADTAETSGGSIVQPVTPPAPFSHRSGGNDRRPTRSTLSPMPSEPARSTASRSHAEIADRPARVEASARPARAESRNSARQRDTDQAPTIEVTIGRIEVRALTPPPQARPAPPRSMLRSLDDYLKSQPRN